MKAIQVSQVGGPEVLTLVDVAANEILQMIVRGELKLRIHKRFAG
jgi:hypothetical protein